MLTLTDAEAHHTLGFLCQQAAHVAKTRGPGPELFVITLLVQKISAHLHSVRHEPKLDHIVCACSPHEDHP